MAKLSVQIPRAASLVENSHCGTPLNFLSAMGSKMRNILDEEVKAGLESLQTQALSGLEGAAHITAVFTLSLAALFDLVEHPDIPSNFKDMADALATDPRVRDMMLTTDAARLCIARLLRASCEAFKIENAKMSEKKNVGKAAKKPVEKDLIYQSSTDEAAPAAKEYDIEMEDADIGDVSNLFAFDPMKIKKRQAESVKRMSDAGDDTDEGDFHVTNTRARRRRVNYAVVSEDSDEDEQDSFHIETEKQREASGHEDMPPELSEAGMSRLDMQPSTDETSTRSPQIRIKEKKSHDVSEMMLLDESGEGRLLVPFGDGENTVSSEEHNAEGQLSGDVGAPSYPTDDGMPIPVASMLEEEEDVGVGGSSSAEQTVSDQSEGRSAATRGMAQKSRRRSGYVLNSDSDYDSV